MDILENTSSSCVCGSSAGGLVECDEHTHALKLKLCACLTHDYTFHFCHIISLERCGNPVLSKITRNFGYCKSANTFELREFNGRA